MKTILYLNHDFFIYDRAIAEELRRCGYEVIFRNFIRQAGFMDRRRCKKQGILPVQYASNRCQSTILSELSKKKICVDAVLVTSGQAMTEDTLKTLHQMYPQAKFIWNLWDSINEIDHFEVLQKYFDILISFDKIEAERYGFVYSPDFYIKEASAAQKKYDYCFVATYTVYRNRVLQDMLSQIQGKHNFIYLKETPNNRIVPTIRRIFSGEEKKLAERNIYYQALDYDAMLEIFAESRCIIDIAHPGQTGLSMRPFEAMAVKSKLLTTNKTIDGYDFYQADNIYIADPEELHMPPDDFLNGPYRNLPGEIYRRYSVESWCDKIQRLIE